MTVSDAAILPSTVHAQAASKPRAAATAHERLAREIYAELVGINTVDSVGSTTRAARAMERRFREAGFPAGDVHVLIPPGDSTKGNLVVRYRAAAKTSAKPILLLAHIDVVAALRSDWPRDPFTLHEQDGFFYGRGSADDKAMAAIFVANLLRYKSEGWRPSRDLILALTAAEEGGANNGVEWLIRQHRDLIDAAYAINEGGGGTLVTAGSTVRPLYHTVQAAEKVPENFTLTVRNPGGHSSVPRPDNAIYTLAESLVRLAKFTFPVAINPVTRAFFEQTARIEQPEIAAAMKAIAADPRDATAARTLSRVPRFASMLRTTCVATRLSGGHAENALPQTATANVNCRIAPTSSAEETQSALARVLSDTAIVITFADSVRERFPESAQPVDATLLAATVALTRQMWGDIPVIPTMSTGATDGRFLRAAGIPTYGVSGIFSLPGETNSHGRDEKLRTTSFYEGLEFLDKLVRRLAGPESGG
ncbi:MAG TPA: M20/M25/M40 family metallo-hydrolase [Gemmatimonadaceae bacterium]|nr:M20/M25/M40 family metallo-hydrolase [Gemmatimonadaceae bacterium]